MDNLHLEDSVRKRILKISKAKPTEEQLVLNYSASDIIVIQIPMDELLEFWHFNNFVANDLEYTSFNIFAYGGIDMELSLIPIDSIKKICASKSCIFVADDINFVMNSIMTLYSLDEIYINSQKGLEVLICLMIVRNIVLQHRLTQSESFEKYHTVITNLTNQLTSLQAKNLINVLKISGLEWWCPCPEYFSDYSGDETGTEN